MVSTPCKIARIWLDVTLEKNLGKIRAVLHGVPTLNLGLVFVYVPVYDFVPPHQIVLSHDV